MSKKLFVGLLLIVICVYGGVRWWYHMDQNLPPLARGVLVTKNMETDKYSVVDLADAIPVGLPMGVATDSKNYVYVSSCQSHNIYVFDDRGGFIRTIGEVGQRQGQFYYPRAIYISDDLLYVGDSGNHRIQILTLEGEFLEEIVLSKNHRIIVNDLVVINDVIYLTNETSSRSDKIYAIDQDRNIYSYGKFFNRYNGYLASVGEEQIVFFDDRHVYETVYLVDGHRLVEGFNRPEGSYQTKGVTYCDEKNVYYVIHSNYQQVDILSAQGEYLTTIYAEDMSISNITPSSLIGITLDNRGIVYVVGRGKVLRITPNSSGRDANVAQL